MELVQSEDDPTILDKNKHVTQKVKFKIPNQVGDMAQDIDRVIFVKEKQTVYQPQQQPQQQNVPLNPALNRMLRKVDISESESDCCPSTSHHQHQQHQTQTCTGINPKKLIIGINSKNTTIGINNPKNTTIGINNPKNTTIGINNPKNTTIGINNPKNTTIGINNPKNTTIGINNPKNTTIGINNPKNATIGIKPKNTTIGINPKNKTIDINPKKPIIGINPKKPIIGICHKKGVQRQESSNQALQTCGLKRKCFSGMMSQPIQSPPIIRPANIRDSKKKEVMEGVNAFNTPQQSVVSGDVVLNEKELDKNLLHNDHQFEAHLGNVVASGSFGRIYDWNGHTTSSDKRVKVKEIQRNPKLGRQQINPNEIIIPYVLENHGIVRILGIRYSWDKLWIVMEDAGPSLKWWMSNRNDDEFRQWIPQNLTDFGYELFKIGSWLERHNIVHRDIKMENVCVLKEGDQFVPTLVDFGSIQTEQDRAVMSGHTPEFLPPGLVYFIYMFKRNQSVKFERQFFEEKCDTWGFAMVILSLHRGGFHPIDEVNQYGYKPDLLEKQRIQVMEKIIHMKEGEFQGLIDTMVGPLKVVVENILCLDASRRWTSKGACNHLEQSDGGINTKPVKKKARNDDVLFVHGCIQKPSSSQSNSTATDLPLSFKNWKQQHEQNLNPMVRFNLTKTSTAINATFGGSFTVASNGDEKQMAMMTNTDTVAVSTHTNPFATSVKQQQHHVSQQSPVVVVEGDNLAALGLLSKSKAGRVVSGVTGIPLQSPASKPLTTKGRGACGWSENVRNENRNTSYHAQMVAGDGGTSPQNMTMVNNNNNQSRGNVSCLEMSRFVGIGGGLVGRGGGGGLQPQSVPTSTSMAAGGFQHQHLQHQQMNGQQNNGRDGFITYLLGGGSGGGGMSAQPMEQEDFVVAGGAAATAGSGRMVMGGGGGIVVGGMSLPNFDILR